MNETHDATPAATQLRAALDHHWGAVMSMTDTERELARFQQSVQQDSRRRGVIAAAASVAVLAAAGGAYLAMTDRGGIHATPANGSPVTGSMKLLLVQNTALGESPVSRQEQHRDAVWEGPLQLSVDGQERAGTLELNGDAGAIHSSDGPVVFHSAGTARATIGDTECEGAFGVSYYREPHDAGGSLHLACDDGTVLAATLAIESIRPEDMTERYYLVASLENGFYTE